MYEDISYGKIKMQPRTREVYLAHKRVNLRNKEYDLLHYFLKNIGRVITRAQLLEEVWDRNIICNSNTIDVHVSQL
jgi:two-component system response regulator RegX3